MSKRTSDAAELWQVSLFSFRFSFVLSSFSLVFTLFFGATFGSYVPCIHFPSFLSY